LLVEPSPVTSDSRLPRLGTSARREFFYYDGTDLMAVRVDG